MRQRVPQNLCGVEHRTLDTRSDEMRWSATGSRQHDAAVAAAKTAAHDLLERYVAASSIGPGQLCDGAHHRRRTAGVDTHVGATRRGTQGRFERRRHVAVGAAAAVLGCEYRLDVQSFEEFDVRQL